MRIISIDVGIKNLAYCIMESVENKSFKIIKWDVINLCGNEDKCNCKLSIKKTSKKQKKIVEKIDKNNENNEIVCNKKALYFKEDNYYCKIHAKKQTTYIIPTTQLCIKKINKMKLVDLQSLCTSHKINYPMGSKKEVVLAETINYFNTKFLNTTSTISANDMNIVSIGIAIQKELDKIQSLMEVDYIIIENQISPIANRMKTIQGMIAQYFIMNNKKSIAFISAANKLKSFTNGEKTTYSERKKASTEITLKLLESDISFKLFFSSHKKKDDLADSFLQGLWFLQNKKLVDITLKE